MVEVKLHQKINPNFIDECPECEENIFEGEDGIYECTVCDEWFHDECRGRDFNYDEGNSICNNCEREQER